MKILRTTSEAIERAARVYNFRVEYEELNPSKGGGYTFHVKLYPTKETSRRAQNPITGRRINAVCWHGFRDFYRALFATTPNAGIRSAIASWDGSEDFEANYRETGHRQVGSGFYPYSIVDKCDCPETGYAW